MLMLLLFNFLMPSAVDQNRGFSMLNEYKAVDMKTAIRHHE